MSRKKRFRRDCDEFVTKLTRFFSYEFTGDEKKIGDLRLLFWQIYAYSILYSMCFFFRFIVVILQLCRMLYAEKNKTHVVRFWRYNSS